MKIEDALKLLGFSKGNVTSEEIKTAYRKAAFQYHPDRNPAGLEMMKMLNAAYEAAKDFSGQFNEEVIGNYGELINNALMAIIELGLTIEICGTWVWVMGDTKTHKETLKAAGYLWAPKKLAWYFRAEEDKKRGYKSTYTMEHIRAKYGSALVKEKTRMQLTF